MLRLLANRYTNCDGISRRSFMQIGSLAHMSDVAADMQVRRRFPVIAEALLFAASGQLRNMATIGGNIMQRTAAPISAITTIPRATNGGRAPAARPATGSIATTRSSAGRIAASRPIPPTSPWRSPPSTPT